MRNALLLVMLLAVGCKGDKKSCSVSVGACESVNAQHCGVSLACEGKTLEIKCTPPADATAKQMDCQCVENGVIGQKVQLVYPLSAPSAEALAKTACGWK